MGMEEKDFKKILDEQMEDLHIPDSLKPENVEKRLEETGKKRRMRYYKKVLASAACAVVVVGAAAVAGRSLLGRMDSTATGYTADSAAVSESASEDGGKSASAGSGSKAAGNLVDAIESAEDYDEIYQYIKEEYESRNQTDNGWIVMEDATDSAASVGTEKSASVESYSSASDNSGTMDAGASAEYSDTNVREEGVGEADIVKTDGKHLYILNNRNIQIVGIDQDEMESLGVISMDDEDYVSEIYIKDDKLIVVYSRSVYGESSDSAMYGGTYREYTEAETFDVSDPGNPKSMGVISQSGGYYTMRVVGDYVYMLSTFYADVASPQKDYVGYVPEVQGKLMDSSDILMPKLSRGSQYTIVTSFSLEDPEEKVDSKAVFGTSGLCYVSNKNIYICEGYYDAEESNVTQTCIRKISYRDGELEGVGQTKIDGTLNDSFSIDEYEGDLRLVVTVSPTGSSAVPITLFSDISSADHAANVDSDSNSLYILDEKLNELSRIDRLAEDERVYSARFMGDTGYFVTYRQMDPLFSVDLSDPEKPEVIGELKIPGFSDYLHPYGDGLLLGIGMDVDETGTTTNGVKLSMFDISDPSDVQEIDKYVLEDFYSTDVSYNYKAALVDSEKNLIGFPAYGEELHYYVFSYDEDGFTCLFDRELTGYYSNVRGLYIGDRFYLVAGNTVEAFSLNTFDKVDDIVL